MVFIVLIVFVFKLHTVMIAVNLLSVIRSMVIFLILILEHIRRILNRWNLMKRVESSIIL